MSEIVYQELKKYSLLQFIIAVDYCKLQHSLQKTWTSMHIEISVLKILEPVYIGWTPPENRICPETWSRNSIDVKKGKLCKKIWIAESSARGALVDKRSVRRSLLYKRGFSVILMWPHARKLAACVRSMLGTGITDLLFSECRNSIWIETIKTQIWELGSSFCPTE